MPPTTAGWTAVFAGPRGRLTVGLTGITFIAATESLVVTSIMPAVVHDIGGLALYGLAFSGFFVAGVASVPLAGRAADRYGPSRPFAILIGIFALGTLLAAVAPSMPVLILGRVMQGYGAGAQFTVSMGTIAKGYPPELRARVLVLMSAVWVLPGLAGPSYGALMASTVGWRWAFASLLVPTVGALWLTYPELRRLRLDHPDTSVLLPVRWPVQLALGAGLVVVGLSSVSWLGLGAVLAGAALAVPALRHVLPAGSFSARPGLPAVVATAFALNTAFYSGSAFVPLLLTGLRGRTVAVAGIAVSLVTVSWTVGSWINTHLIERMSPQVVARAGAVTLLLGIAGFASALLGAPLWLVYGSWAIGGAGMGIVFNAVTLAGMSASAAGQEGTVMSARNLSATLGTSMGTGLGGVSIAVTQASGLGLAAGLKGVYLLSTAAALVTVALAGRLARPHTSRP